MEQRNGYAPVYYLTREAFETEICGGYDKDFVCKVLCDAGWLRKGSSRWTKQLKRSGMTTAWFYVLEGSQPPEKQPADGESSGGR